MKSVLSIVVVVVTLGAATGTALAVPAGESPDPVQTAISAQPAPADDGGSGALTIALIGAGGVLALGGAATAGVRVGRRSQRLHSSGV